MIIQWLLISLLLPLYSLWVLGAENREVERAIAYAMELTNTLAFVELQSAWDSRDVCTVTPQESSTIASAYETYQESILVDGQTITVLHFTGKVPKTSEIQALLGEFPSEGMVCLPVYENTAPVLLSAPVS